MSVEQLLLALPAQAGELASGDLTNHQWVGILEQFAAQGGREVLLGGDEPLAFPGFWLLAKRATKLRIPRVTAYVSGSFLEPWVQRELVESGIHLLVALDSLQPSVHQALHRSGSHARATAALDTFLDLGLQSRVGVLATATRLNHEELPSLMEWAAQRGVARFVWSTVPDGGWPSAQLKSLRLSPEEKLSLASCMTEAARSFATGVYVGPLDPLDGADLPGAYTRLLRVNANGEAGWGFSGDGARLGSLKRATLETLLQRADQAAGD